MDYRISEHRSRACEAKLAILHQNGSVGYIERSSRYDASIVFPNWRGVGRKQYEYGEFSQAVKILTETYAQVVANKDQKEMTQALYEITKEDGSKVFATKMAEKSKTLWVMEIKGTGEFVAVETSFIQEVVPHTIKVKFFGASSITHFEAEEGKFSVGDVLVLKSGDIVSVVELNSKQKGAPELKAQSKLATVAL